MRELSDILVCRYGGIYGSRGNVVGNVDIVEFGIAPVDVFTDMTVVECNMESILAHTSDAGHMAVMLGSGILAFYMIVDVEGISGESRVFGTYHGGCC